MASITLVPYDPAWPERFAEIGAALRGALDPVLGDRLTRIDHIGSTSVPGIAAKPIIDVQVSVRDFLPADDPAATGYAPRPRPPDDRRHVGYRGETRDPIATAIESAGFSWAGDWCTDWRKWLFRRRSPYGSHPLPAVDANLHVGREGCVSQQQALLFRDLLRTHEEARRRYEAVKRDLATREWAAVDDYADAKGDCVWALLRQADVWSWNGWRPGPSDA
jgi:GrpB-like predicted nucleotidyltransferase (UPF0157 family)